MRGCAWLAVRAFSGKPVPPWDRVMRGSEDVLERGIVRGMGQDSSSVSVWTETFALAVVSARRSKPR